MVQYVQQASPSLVEYYEVAVPESSLSVLANVWLAGTILPARPAGRWLLRHRLQLVAGQGLRAGTRRGTP